VRFANGSLFYAEHNGSIVARVNPDGTGHVALASSTKPWSVAVDTTHVYYQANSGNLERTLVTGGAPEDVGPLEQGATLGFTAMDAERVYWAYGEFATPTGHVYSLLKANPAAPKVQYGTTNKNSVGVAVDATTLYWTNSGTFDGGNNSNKDGELLACPKAGCGAAPVVVQQGLTQPSAIVVDGEAIYFLTFGTSAGSADGELRRIAKP
jgi:hypothetical protein